MKKALQTLLILMSAVSAMAQTPALSTSNEYPLMARIVSVEMRTGTYETTDITTDSDGKVHGGGSGGTYEWHLMKAVIGDKLYGLSVKRIPFTKRTWLEIGSYPAKRVKSGFEFQYTDDKGKVRHEVLHIQSEEAAPTTLSGMK